MGPGKRYRYAKSVLAESVEEHGRSSRGPRDGTLTVAKCEDVEGWSCVYLDSMVLWLDIGVMLG
jgi:hypothetical protein